MPGSGKSTLGRRLAQQHGLGFIDTDEMIERRYGFDLQVLLDRHGHQYIRKIEEQVICSMQLENHVIATGGSAVYSDLAMRHLAALGRIIYLHISLPTLLARVSAAPNRGIAIPPSVSLASLFHQRLPLYKKWADHTIENNRPLSAWQFEQLAAQFC